MKIGQFVVAPSPDKLSAAERFAQVFELIEVTRDSAFDSVWVAEHHFSNYSMIPNPLLMALDIAKRMPDMHVGTAVLLLPLWHPVRLAEDVALLDVLTGGRFELGIGRGYLPYEFAGFDVDLKKNRALFDEALDILLGCLTVEDFEHHGATWDVAPTSVTPRPTRVPPIWMAATSPASIRRAVERGFHLSTGTGAFVEELSVRNSYIDACAQRSGRDMRGIERAAARFICCTTDPAAARRAVEEARWQARASRALTLGGQPARGDVSPFAQPYEGEQDLDSWQKRMVIGPPEQCLETIEQLAGAGVSYVLGLFDFGGLAHTDAMRSMELFLAEVAPKLVDITPSYRQGDGLIAEAERYEAEAAALENAGPYALR